MASAEVARRLQDLRDPNSTYYRGAESFLARIAQVADAGGYDVGSSVGRGDEKRIPYVLKGEEVRRLSTEFGWRMVSQPREYSRVPFVDAKRYCAGLLNESIKGWAGEEVVHLEGDVTTVVARRQTWKHVCRAGASSTALHRYCAQGVTLRRMMSSRNTDVALMAKKVLDTEGTAGAAVMCSSARACTVVCDTVLGELAEADVSSMQAAAVIVQHQAVRYKTWFFFETLMLYQDEGPLTSFPGRFFVDRGNDRVYIVPDGAVAVDCIEYRWSNVLSYLRQPTVVYRGENYMVELHDSVPGILFAIVSDARGACEFEVDTEHRLYHPAGEPMVEITQRITLPKAVGGKKLKEDVTIRVPQEVWEKCITRMSGVKEQRLTLADTRVAVSDNSQQRVDVGVFIKAPKVMPFDVPDVLARGVWKKVTTERARMRLESELARQNVDTSWGNTLQKLVAVAMRTMHETSMTLDTFLLTAAQWTGVYDADYGDYQVHVQPVATEEVIRTAAGTVAGPWFMSGAFPGGPDADGGSDTDGSELRAEVRARAFEVFDSIRGFDAMPSDSSSSGGAASVDDVQCRAEARLTEAERKVNEMKFAYGVSRVRRDGEDGLQPNASVAGGFDVASDTRGDVEHDQLYVMESQLSVGKVSGRELGKEREELVGKMEFAYGVAGVRSVPRVEEVFVTVSEPECQPEVGVADPVSVLQQDYAEDAPALSGYHPEITPFLVAEADKAFSYEAHRVVTNAMKDQLPQPMTVRRSRLLTACGGRRPVTQTEALFAFGKRVANAPNLSQDVVYEERLRQDFDRFQDVLLRPGWDVRMREAVAAGLWQLDMVEIKRHVAKLATSSVGVMIREDFNQGRVDLTRWLAMVKGVVKPKMSESAATSYAAPQTIVYQASKMTNSWFSPMLSKFLDFLDQESQPWVRLNARRDESDDERWINSMERRSKAMGGVWVDTDISQCDKSQQLYNMQFFFYVLQRFGAPDELVSLWKVMIGVKRADAVDVGMAIWYVFQVVSGFFGTIAANTFNCAAANVVCLRLRKEELVTFEARGDDVLVKRVDSTDAVRAAEDFVDKFNYEAKVNVNAVPYFCSHYDVVVDGYHYRVRDPIKMRESLGRYVAPSADLGELYDSYRDAMRHYDKKEVMDALDVAVQARLGRGTVRGTLRALSTLRASKELFVGMYESDVSIIG